MLGMLRGLFYYGPMELSLHLRSYAHNVDEHSHDHHQLVLPVTGSLDLSIEGQGGEVSAQNLAVIEAGKSHAFAGKGENHFLVLDVPESMSDYVHNLPCYLPTDEALHRYIRFLQAWQQSAQSSDLLASCDRQAMVLLLQMLQAKKDAPQKLDQRLDKVCQIIEADLSANLNVEQLAQVAAISVRQLNSLFQRYLGLSAKQYIIEKRMQKAWRLLVGSQMPVQQVAEAVGYQDASAFAHRCKQSFGLSASEIRQKHQLERQN